MNFTDWLRHEMDSRGKSSHDVDRETDLSHVTILRLLKGGHPHLDTLFQIAQWAKVEPAFLMRLLGYDVSKPPWPKEREIALLIKGDPRFAKLFELASELKPGQLRQALDFIQFLLR